jgi:hypothetical protein
MRGLAIGPSSTDESAYRLPADAGRLGDPRERVPGARLLELGDGGHDRGAGCPLELAGAATLSRPATPPPP